MTKRQATSTVTSVIDGSRDAAETAQVIEARNPADLDEIVAEIHLATPEGFARACRAARDGRPGWAATPAPVRGEVIANVAHLVRENKRELAAYVTREVGKTAAEALGEVQEVIDTCELFLGEGRRLYGMTVPSEMPDKQLMTFRMPVGVAAVITAGNFPTAVPSWYLVPALLCGNTVVWKPADYAGATAGAMAELFWHGGVPADALHLVQADGEATFRGLELALDEGTVDKVGFTGSTDVGRKIGALCGRHLQSPCLELGGKNPLVVTRRRRSRPGHGGRAVFRLRDRGPALHFARHGDRRTRRSTTTSSSASWSRPSGRRSATRPRTCCTGR